MKEPQRIGLTKKAHDYLDEMLEYLNCEASREKKLIKFDLYRLSVAVGVKKGVRPEPLSEQPDDSFRVAELDQDKALFFAVDAANIQGPDEAVYQIIERLAELGIRHFYDAYQKNMGKLPWDKLLV